MDTLGGNTKKIISKEESWAINQGFICTEKVSAGTLVKLNSDGTVTPVKADTELAIGIVSAGCNIVNGEVTIQTQYNAILRGKADGAIAMGAELYVTGMVTENGSTLSKYKTIASGKSIVAQALSAATNTNDVLVGVFRVFNTKA